MRREYEMSEDDLAELLDASKPTPAMWGSNGVPFFGTQQENANRAWCALGERMGFDYTTVQPAAGKGQRFFTAEQTEKEIAK